MLKNQSAPSNRAYSQVNLDQLLSEVIALRERAKALEVGLEGKMLGRKVHSRTESAGAVAKLQYTQGSIEWQLGSAWVSQFTCGRLQGPKQATLRRCPTRLGKHG
jgi:hypothetical protein